MVKSKLLFFLIFLITLISCSKDNNEKQGYYTIEYLTNMLDVPIKVEIATVTKKLSNNDKDFNKNLKFRTISIINPEQTIILDSTFVCTKNCDLMFDEMDPEMKPIFLKLTYNDKVKIDTNCQHPYVYSGIIQKCQKDRKNYFDKKYWSSYKDNSGNPLFSFRIDKSYLANAD